MIAPSLIPHILHMFRIGAVSRERQKEVEQAYADLEIAHEQMRRTERTLRIEHQYVTRLLAALDEQVIVCDSTGQVVFINHVKRTDSAPSLPDVLAELQFFDADTRAPLPREQRPISRALKGETVVDAPVMFRRGDGELRMGVAMAKPIYDEDGTTLGAFAVLRDITEQLRAEEDLSAIRLRNEVILDAAGEGICGIDVNGATILMNPAAEAISGWSFEELKGRLRHALVHHTRVNGQPYPWNECPEYLTLRDGQSRKVKQDVFWRQDGSWFPVKYVVDPIIEDGRITGAVVVFEDLSERLILQQELEQARRVESLGRLAATMAHEFNNVLMGIQPFVEAIRPHANEHEEVTRSLGFIESSVRRGKKISQEILRYTQPADPVVEDIDVRAWVDDLMNEAKPLLGPQIRVAIEIAPDVTGMAGDALQLHQAFLNILLNARDAMPQGGTIRFAARRESADASFSFGTVPGVEDFVHFVIADTGQGIAPEVMNHLFEPLFTTKKSGGTGLGLALVRQVVRRHEGSVFAESTKGWGAAFHVFITQSRVSPKPALSVRASEDLTGRKILLVEDEEPVSAGVTLLLEMEGLEVRAVDRGGAAIDAIEKFGPELVILDIGLPDISGDRVFAQIAERWPGLPVIFSTGHGDPSSVREHRASSNVEFISKPYEAGALLLLIEKLLGSQTLKMPAS